MNNGKVTKMVPKGKPTELENKVKQFGEMAGQVVSLLGPENIEDEEALKIFKAYSVSLADRQNTITNLMKKKNIIRDLIEKECGIYVQVFPYSDADRKKMEHGAGKIIRRICNISYFGDKNFTLNDLKKALTVGGESEEEIKEQANVFTERINSASEMISSMISLRDPEFDTLCFTYACTKKPANVDEKLFNETIELSLLERIELQISKKEAATIFRHLFGTI